MNSFYRLFVFYLSTPLFLFFQTCDKDNGTKEKGVQGEPFVDQGISQFADNDPLNDVFMQGFWWDSFNDPKIASYPSYYAYLEAQVVALSNAHIDLIWLPPSSEGVGMGYHPRRLFDFTSEHGSEAELRSLISALKSRKMHAMADLVFNHRVGTDTWTDFTEPAWGCDAICEDDESATNPDAFGTPPCGALDEGFSWGGARDLNHQSREVQEGLKEYLNRLQELGFDSWRYDYVKGFPARYVATYNKALPYYYSVGEFWDGELSAIKNWIDQTETTHDQQRTTKAAAFDFALKYKLHEAIVQKEYTRLEQNTSLANTFNYGNHSVTFVDNHDSGCINRDDCDNLFSKQLNSITQAYVYLLTHPGIPMIWSYHYFFSDASGTLQKQLNELIRIRKENTIQANSTVDVLKVESGSNGVYVGEIDNRIVVKIGFGDYAPSTDWELLLEGKGFVVWKK